MNKVVVLALKKVEVLPFINVFFSFYNKSKINKKKNKIIKFHLIWQFKLEKIILINYVKLIKTIKIQGNNAEV